MMADTEDHYDTPWEFLKRPNSVRLSQAHVRLSMADSQRLPGSPTSMVQSPSFSGAPMNSPQLVHIGNNSPPLIPSSDCRRLSSSLLRLSPSDTMAGSSSAGGGYNWQPTRSEEDILLEKNIDRIEAEKRLEGKETGDFLLRYRSEGSGALSLRGSTGILHIKIEKKRGKWIVGEGPCFRTIASAIKYYRQHPLPIRNSDHLILKKAIATSGQLH